MSTTNSPYQKPGMLSSDHTPAIIAGGYTPAIVPFDDHMFEQQLNIPVSIYSGFKSKSELNTNFTRKLGRMTWTFITFWLRIALSLKVFLDLLYSTHQWHT